MKENPLLQLEKLGQSIWLDYTRRDLLRSGALRRLIDEDGLRGMTSNPDIFEKAITGSDSYEEDIRTLALHGKSPNGIYESLSQRDVQEAADEFRSVYDREGAKDGFVSLEVNPHLAYDTKGTIVEARRLWRALNRPNVFIKVPATAEGVTAIRQLISDGINVNVTLLFGLQRYREVAEAFIAGLEARAAAGKPLESVASVASFFLSRIDSLVDPIFEKALAQTPLAKEFRGQVAISSAKLAYQTYKQLFEDKRFEKLVAQGASRQRLLWASTSTKNSAYSDLKYVDALIGSETINTVTVATLDAYRDHGEPALCLEHDLETASRVLQQLPALGVDLDRVALELEKQGVARFNEAFDNLMTALAGKSAPPS